MMKPHTINENMFKFTYFQLGNHEKDRFNVSNAY